MKVIIMKVLKGILLVFLMCMLWVSCLQEEAIHEEVTPILTEEKGLTIEEQLMWFKTEGEDAITRSIYAENTKLSLLDYHMVGTIASKQELESLKADFLSEKSIFPYYNMNSRKIELKTFSEIEDCKPNDTVQYSKINLVKYLNGKIAVGMKKLELVWMWNSNTYITTCVIDNDEIVYDNIISNIYWLEKVEVPDKCIIPSRPLIKTRAEGGGNNNEPIVQDFVHSIISYHSLKPGSSDRVTITHSIHGYRGNLISSSCYAEAYWFSPGSADAQATVQHHLGSNGYSDCYYAWYITGPVGSVHISGGVPYSFDIAIGDHQKGSGVDCLTTENFWPEP